MLGDDDGIEIELRDLGQLVGHQADPQQQVLDPVDGSRRRAAVAEEQRRAAERPNEIVRVDIGERKDAHRPVAEQLGRRSAESEHHDRTERRVVHDADDRLDAGGHHRLHDPAAHLVAEARFHRRRTRRAACRRR